MRAEASGVIYCPVCTEAITVTAEICTIEYNSGSNKIKAYVVGGNKEIVHKCDSKKEFTELLKNG